MNPFRSVAYVVVAILGLQIMHAQTAQAIHPATSTELDRKIEIMVRLKFEIPTACDIKIGKRSPMRRFSII